MPNDESNEKLSESNVDDEPESERKGTEDSGEKGGSSQLWWKVAVVALLLVAIVGIIASKQNETQNATPETDQASGASKYGDDEEEKGEDFPADTVLATVNGEEITRDELDAFFQTVPEQHRAAFKNSKHELLEQLITRELLLQQARALAEEEGEETQGDQETESDDQDTDDNEVIESLLQRRVLDDIDVTEEEVKEFYERNKAQIPSGRSFEDVKDTLRNYALQEKQSEAVVGYVKKLDDEADITRNEEWVEVQKARADDNPLDRALDKDMPVLADFGRDSCTPCKMMKPILEKLESEYKGRAEVLIINTNEHPNIAQREGVRAIPTQIFYDAEGNEVDRHQGFMSREDLVEKLQELGVE